MKLKNVVAGSVLLAGLGAGALAGMGVASAAPGSDIAQKPHHGHEWDDWGPGRGHGHGNWGNAGWNGIDACVSATGPYGYVSGSVCI